MELEKAKQRIEKAVAARHLTNIVGNCYVEYHVKMELVHVNAGEVLCKEAVD